MRVLLSCLLVAILGLPAIAAPWIQEAPSGSIEIEGYHPDKNLFLERDSKFTVLVKGVDATRLRVIYRPTSKVEALEDIGEIQGGKIVWTPSQAGLAKLEAFVLVEVKDEKGDTQTRPKVLVSRVVSIKPGEGFPLGLLIMALAGAILFFGAFASIRALLRS